VSRGCSATLGHGFFGRIARGRCSSRVTGADEAARSILPLGAPRVHGLENARVSSAVDVLSRPLVGQRSRRHGDGGPAALGRPKCALTEQGRVVGVGVDPAFLERARGSARSQIPPLAAILFRSAGTSFRDDGAPRVEMGPRGRVSGKFLVAATQACRWPHAPTAGRTAGLKIGPGIPLSGCRRR